MPEEKKLELKEYQQNYRKAKKSKNNELTSFFCIIASLSIEV